MTKNIVLHVKHFVYKRFLGGSKLVEYRPLCQKYFYLLDSFRIDFERGLKPCINLRIVDGCSNDYVDFFVSDICLVEFSKIPEVDQKALSCCYGANLEGHYFYAIYL